MAAFQAAAPATATRSRRPALKRSRIQFQIASPPVRMYSRKTNISAAPLTSWAASERPPSTPLTTPPAASLAAGRMLSRKLRIASSCSCTHSLLSCSQATTSSAPALMSSPTPPRLPNSASVNTHASPIAITRTPRRLPATASPRGIPRPVAQSTSGSTCVLMSAATISGTVAPRAYQIAPPTRNTPAVISSALALHCAMALPAAARGAPSADIATAPQDQLPDLGDRDDGQARPDADQPLVAGQRHGVEDPLEEPELGRQDDRGG